MKDEELLRYSRQIMLPQIDFDGQNRLIKSRALIIGLGGLGSPSSLYLAAAGVGHLILADFDKVEISNLQRQIIHKNNDIGRYKVDSAKDTLLSINPKIKISNVKKIDNNKLALLISKADIVLDCTDNFKSRFLINKLCFKIKKPLVSAAVIRFEGQLSVFKGYEENKPCYNCLYCGDENSQNCTNNGILSPVAGVLGTLQALQTLKVLLNIGDQLCGELMLIDALSLQFRKVIIEKDNKCSVCS